MKTELMEARRSARRAAWLSAGVALCGGFIAVGLLLWPEDETGRLWGAGLAGVAAMQLLEAMAGVWRHR